MGEDRRTIERLNEQLDAQNELLRKYKFAVEEKEAAVSEAMGRYRKMQREQKEQKEQHPPSEQDLSGVCPKRHVFTRKNLLKGEPHFSLLPQMWITVTLKASVGCQ